MLKKVLIIESEKWIIFSYIPRALSDSLRHSNDVSNGKENFS